MATLLLACAVLASAISAGHSGGALVYEHGAASAYAARSHGGPSHGSLERAGSPRGDGHDSGELDG